MERTLSLVLDDEGKISLTLMKDEANKLDDFTTKNFENSEEIRNFFKDKIEKYLEENKKYVETVTKKTGKKFRGRIIILEVIEEDSNLYFIEKRVLYKKHLIAFKELVKDEKTMKRFLKLEKIGYNQYRFRRLVSPFLVREISTADYRKNNRVEIIRREIKKSKKNFYDMLRIICKAYEYERGARNLPTIDMIYKNYKETKEQELMQIPVKKGHGIIRNEDLDDEQFISIDGQLFPINEAPDLDILKKGIDTDYSPDGLGQR